MESRGEKIRAKSLKHGVPSRSGVWTAAVARKYEHITQRSVNMKEKRPGGGVLAKLPRQAEQHVSQRENQVHYRQCLIKL